MRILDAEAVFAACGPAAAVDAIVAALRAGLDPAADPPRHRVPLRAGELLLMPSEGSRVGVKVATVAPGNSGRGLPRVQASYLVFDADTLALTAVLDGTALTTLRTPAVSVAAVRARLPESLRVAVFGAGPQARGHVAALATHRPLSTVTYLVRDPARTGPIAGAEVLAVDGARTDPPAADRAGGDAPAADRARADAPAVDGAGTDVPAVDRARVAAVLRRADVIVCATTARTPLFDADLVSGTAVVIAVGSHEPDAREVPAALCARATVVVEDPGAALREAGDVGLAIADGALREEDLVPMCDVVTGRVVPDPGRPLLFKSVGMAWQDLVVAGAVLAGL